MVDHLDPSSSLSTEYATWLAEKGISIEGIQATDRPGRGIGIIATRPLREGDLLIYVPAAALFTVNPHECRKSHCSIHGALAAKMVIEEEALMPWLRAMPSFESLQQCMPVLWSQGIKDLLPPPAKDQLSSQQRKLNRDVMWFESTYLARKDAPLTQEQQEKSRQAFIRSWLLVNTRSFYWDYPLPDKTRSQTPYKVAKKRGLSKSIVNAPRWSSDDCLALCPFIDFFNHANEDDNPCHVSYSHEGFAVTTTRAYSAGEEVFVTYGAHSNDYLMVEYGFTYAPNTADSTLLDQIILPRFDEHQSSMLEEANMIGNYTLAPRGETEQSSGPEQLEVTVCHRTQTALRILILSTDKWRRFADGRDDGEQEQERVDDLVKSCLSELNEKANSADEHARLIHAGQHAGFGDDVRGLDSVRKRWKDIGLMAKMGLD